MARIKRYDLYEGDGEVIGEQEGWNLSDRKAHQPLPGRAPLGRDEELKEKDRLARENEKPAGRRVRYFPENEGEDAYGAPSTLFDDFDRFEEPLPLKKAYPRKKKIRHRGAWIFTIVLCCLFLTAAAVFMLPQLTGIRYKFLPNYAFANGSIIELDEKRAETFHDNVSEIFTDRIYTGVFIDDVDVSGMTKNQAAAAVAAVSDTAGEVFDITVTVGNQSWHVNNERVPVSRNISETVEKAWAQGRRSISMTRGSGGITFAERVKMASSLRSFPVSYYTVKTYDREKLRNLTDGIVNYVNREPINSNVATFDFNTKEFTFTDDVPGAKLDPDDLYNRVAEKLDSGDYYAQIYAVPEKVLARMTKTELKNSFGLISTYTTKTTNNNNRNTNIRLSADAISGTTVLPGETFSFNSTTGERTIAKGYKEATAISGGASRDEVGGGVCQTSSTLFNAVARANLEIVERSPHAWPSSYVEKGFDATVNWPGLDFKFKNNTEWPIFIISYYRDRKVTAEVYGMSLGPDTKIDLESKTVKTLAQPEGTKYEINPDLPLGTEKLTVQGRSGCVVETWKVWKQGNREIKRELLFKSTYKAYQETVEYNPR